MNVSPIKNSSLLRKTSSVLIAVSMVAAVLQIIISPLPTHAAQGTLLQITCDAVQVNGNTWTFTGTWTANDFQGQSNQYDAAIFAGVATDTSSMDSPDTFAITSGPANTTGGPQDDMSGTWSNEVTFASAPPTVFATLYHASVPGNETSGDAQCQFTLPPTNNAPTANPLSITTDENTATSSTLTASDTDSGDTWTFATSSSPANGSITSFNSSTGAFTYTPNTGFSGPDSFQFVAIDNHGATSSPATVSITVNAVVVPPGTTGTLVIQKVVTNDNGGGASPSDFSFHLDGGATTTFNVNGENVFTSVATGTHVVVEDSAEGYGATFSGACDSNGNVTVSVSATSTCTITNNDEQATLVLAKHAIGGNGTFNFQISGANSTSTALTTSGGWATTTIMLNAGTSTVSEFSQTGWNFSTSTCVYDNQSVGNAFAGGETIRVDNGDTVICTFTNISTSTPPDSDLSIEKSISDDTPGISQGVVYTLTVSNAGPADATDVVVTDVLPSSLTYESDDSSGAYNSTTGVWGVGSLANGASATLHINVSANIAGDVVNTATTGFGNAATTQDSNTSNDSATVTVTVHNQFNDTPSSGGGGGGGNGPPVSGGAVLGASTGPVGQVLGASCGLYLNDYLRMGQANNADQVTKLQTFLNEYMHSNLPVTGTFGPATDAAVRAFQASENNGVLKPWVDADLLKPGETTGYVYKTTKRWINLIKCPSLNIPLPQLP